MCVPVAVYEHDFLVGYAAACTKLQIAPSVANLRRRKLTSLRLMINTLVFPQMLQATTLIELWKRLPVKMGKY